MGNLSIELSFSYSDDKKKYLIQSVLTFLPEKCIH